MATEQAQFNITAGPGKWDLAAGLFENASEYPRHVQFTILFQLGNRPWWLQSELPVVSTSIQSIEREDGSGESWNLVGEILLAENQRVRFFAYYNSRRRTGAMKIEK